MASNGETGALLLAASVRECVSLCVCVCACWRDRLLGSEGRGADRHEEEEEEKEERRTVWVPEYYRLETW